MALCFGFCEVPRIGLRGLEHGCLVEKYQASSSMRAPVGDVVTVVGRRLNSILGCHNSET